MVVSCDCDRYLFLFITTFWNIFFCSFVNFAGARGSMVHLDYVSEFLGSAASANTNVTGWIDSGCVALKDVFFLNKYSTFVCIAFIFRNLVLLCPFYVFYLACGSTRHRSLRFLASRPLPKLSLANFLFIPPQLLFLL